MRARPTCTSGLRCSSRRRSRPHPSARARALERVRHASREARLAEFDDHVGQTAVFLRESASASAGSCE
eukprot:3318931-Pyramimonas_sp.AAC.1